MILESLQNVELAKTINSFIVLLFLWGFFMSYKNWRSNPSVFILASVFLASFTFGSNVFNEYVLHLDETPIEYYYLDYIRDDLLAIVAVMLAHFALKINVQKVTVITLSILLLNSLMYAFMHIDIVELQNKTAPWTWWDSFYTVFINAIEILVASIIILHSLVNKKSNNTCKV